VETLRADLLGQVGWVTPNREELAVLIANASGQVVNADDVEKAAAILQHERPALNVVVTGGDSNPPSDFLRTADGEEHWFAGERIETSATHGTGCAFSSSLLASLLQGKTAVEAVKAAKTYVSEAMRAAYKIGKGKGPLHHLQEFGCEK
jgi:hydroxymethylpyrimidine/phosphomethylpyrimidine kinase